ncbi:MAG: FG-GAP repeat protein, partial [Acidimicrobiales bacterium]
MGRDQASYHPSPTAGGFELANRTGSVSARFDGSGAQLVAGGANLRLSLGSVGYGAALQRVPAVEPQADANRVEFSRPGLSEWFVNGPAGLEHGFTLTQPPPGDRDGDLTLGLALGGATASVDGDGLGATLSDGSGSLRYGGLWAADAAGRAVPARLSVAGDELRVAVDDQGATYPITIDPYIDTAKLTHSDRDYQNSFLSAFGVSIGMSGDTIVVGQTPDLENDGWGPEAAYVFVRPAGGWADATQTAKLTAVGGSGNAGRAFGTSVATAGDTIVVGADFESVGGNYRQGSAYVFVRPAGGWVDMTPTAKLTAADGGAEERSGISVAIEGGTIVVGAAFAKGPVGVEDGAAYVFARPAGGWANATQSAKLTGGRPDGLLGWSVAIAGDTIVAGAVERSYGQGSANVFVRSTGGWADMTQPTATLRAADGHIHDHFGRSVAIAGDTIVVGTHVDGAYVFVRPAVGWADATQTAKLTSSDGEAYADGGWSVAIAGNTIVAGDRFTRAVYMFARPAGGWADATQTARLTADFSRVGHSAAISAETIVAGAPWYSTGGAAYVFEPDELAPQTTIDSGPSGTTTDSTPTFEFSSNEARSTFTCRIDSALFNRCDTPTSESLNDGAHTFQVQATDEAENTD